MYCLAVKHLYPDYLKRRSEFVFLKFDLSKDMLGKTGKGLLEMGAIGEDELEGFEYELTEIQKYLDSFNIASRSVLACSLFGQTDHLLLSTIVIAPDSD